MLKTIFSIILVVVLWKVCRHFYMLIYRDLYQFKKERKLRHMKSDIEWLDEKLK